MSIIEKPNNEPLNPRGNINLPCMEVPSFRALLARDRKTTKNILIQTPYALGDCVCAEPAIRYACEAFNGCTISLVTPFPDLFMHLPIVKFYGLKENKPDWDKYNVLRCYYDATELQSEFVHNFNMAIGDYIATCLFKGQIPVADRDIRVQGIQPSERQDVVVHAGRHWVSKTFPKHWWDEVLAMLIDSGVRPCLIGAKIDDGRRGYVDVDPEGCLDLRDKLSIQESLGILQTAGVVLTNDSAP